MIVDGATSAAAAKSRTPSPKATRAIFTCTGVINRHLVLTFAYRVLTISAPCAEYCAPSVYKKLKDPPKANGARSCRKASINRKHSRRSLSPAS